MKIAEKIILIGLVTVFLAGCASQAPYLALTPGVQSTMRVLEGHKYVPLAKLCEAYKLGCDWDTFTKIASLKIGANTIVLRSGSRIVLVNGKERKLDFPVAITDGTVFVPVYFAGGVIAPMASAGVTPAREVPVIEAEKAFTIRTIALDTGHGGKDPGAIGRGRGTKEKDVTLNLSKRVKALLEAAGLKVIMTRNDDTFIPLPGRSKIANDSHADIFVSIHINATLSRSTRGFECYYLSTAMDDNARAIEAFENSSLKLSEDADVEHSRRLDKTLWDMMLTENRKESGELAGFICQSVDESQLTRNNGVKTARFYVLKHTHIPSVLVESGYISNRSEEMRLRDPRYLDSLAEAIVRGILRYKKRYEATEAFTNV